MPEYLNTMEFCWRKISKFLFFLTVILYVQEVVTLKKKIFNIFASENEVYIIY